MTQKKIKHYAFFIDTANCSGCKTCQVACKDKNNLEVGVLWRRVYEISGGDWVKDRDTWQSGVYAYHLSISCNHCREAVCLDACPTGAISRREDGIVTIDSKKCVGCRYCEWACPYGAPQYDQASGVMTKCDFCLDYIDEGKAPACVAACPLRVLEFGELEELVAKHGDQSHIYPLPSPSVTKPAMVLKPHKDAKRAENEDADVVNKEEV